MTETYVTDYHDAYVAVSNYVNNRRWDTLAGKAWNMQDEDSREQFVRFLAGHLVNIVNGEADGR